jgi:hypothetical protein
MGQRYLYLSMPQKLDASATNIRFFFCQEFKHVIRAILESSLLLISQIDVIPTGKIMPLVISETHDGIIEDLSNLGVRVDIVLGCNPTFGQLKEMRDKLMSLSEAVKETPVPRL